MDTTIAVGERIESRIVLVMAAHRRQPKRIGIVFRRIFAKTVEQQEVRLARGGRPDSFAGRGRQMEATPHTGGGVVALEDREDSLDRIAEAVVVGREAFP